MRTGGGRGAQSVRAHKGVRGELTSALVVASGSALAQHACRAEFRPRGPDWLADLIMKCDNGIELRIGLVEVAEQGRQ